MASGNLNCFLTSVLLAFMPPGTTYISLYQLRGIGLDKGEMREQQGRELPVLWGSGRHSKGKHYTFSLPELLHCRRRDELGGENLAARAWHLLLSQLNKKQLEAKSLLLLLSWSTCGLFSTVIPLQFS